MEAIFNLGRSNHEKLELYAMDSVKKTLYGDENGNASRRAAINENSPHCDLFNPLDVRCTSLTLTLESI